MTIRLITLFLLCDCFASAVKVHKGKEPIPSPLDQYILEATNSATTQTAPSPGSLWSPSGQLTDVANDLRASRVNDLVTILVADRASAVSKGTSKSSRATSANSSITALAGATTPKGALASLTNLNSASKLDGSGETTRDSTLTTSLTARVTQVLPNGFLVVEGEKAVAVNSEKQRVKIRGIVRPVDLATNNVIASDRIGQLDVQVNGKGVVGDAIRRPHILYRLLLGILTF